MKIRTLKLPPELDRKVDAYAESRGVSRSSVVREALTRYLADTSPASGSFLDAARDLAGCVEGLSDLSTNPKHMQGFGRSRR